MSASIPPAGQLTLNAAETALLLGWRYPDGRPNAEKVRELYRRGRFPSPIDPELPVRWWSWSRRDIEMYSHPSRSGAA